MTRKTLRHYVASVRNPGAKSRVGAPLSGVRGNRIAIQQAVRYKRLTKLNAMRWNGDPSIAPPPLARPSSAAEYGECPDEQDVPWHKRQKARQS